jgi:uncharacterized membrane protein
MRADRPLRPGPARSPTILLGIAVALTLVFGTWLRFHDLERMVVWHDEVFTLSRVAGFGHEEMTSDLFTGRLATPADLLALQSPRPDRGLDATWQALTEHPEHGPLYYLLARFATSIVTPPLRAARGTAAALSLLLLPALFWLTRELFGSRRAAWIVVAFAAVSPLQLLYAQEARQYGLWMALTAWSSANLLYALRHGHRWPWALYSLSLALGLYTHLLFLQVIAMHGLFLIWKGPRDWRGLLHTGIRPALAVSGALVAFLPWILVMVSELDAMSRFTDWMALDATFGQLAERWVLHINRVFLDLPAAESYAWVGLGIAVAGAIAFLRLSPPTPRVFLTLFVLVPVVMVVAPDLVLGGRRSLMARYLFPLFMAMQLIAGWLLDRGLSAERGLWRASAAVALAALLTGAVMSDLVIAGAHTWWNKGFSASNAALARQVNRAERPLVLASPGAVSAGELISLSHRLEPHVRLFIEGFDDKIRIPQGYSDLFVLLPSPRLRTTLETRYRLEPFRDTWQWFVAVPRSP